ncbi:MAG: InlB B-repeat-containing protein [Clostridia bacterium]|nr:InlB B-repeat-containing protein [Clostridia bacterium]
MKKLLVIATILIVVSACIFTSCVPVEERDWYVEENGWMAKRYGNTVALIGMKGEICEKDELIVPTQIGDLRVKSIIFDNFIRCFVKSQQLVYKANKVFIPGVNYVYETDCNRIDFPIAEKLVFLSTNWEDYTNGFKTTDFDVIDVKLVAYELSSVYLPQSALDSFIDNFAERNYGTKFYPANVSYYYNYEEAPNDGYYWVDDLNLGDRIKTIPDNPQREGYEFCGWYKEKECINEVMLSNLIKGEEEIELFAKWIVTFRQSRG